MSQTDIFLLMQSPRRIVGRHSDLILSTKVSPYLHYSHLYVILLTTRHNTHTHASSTIHLLSKCLSGQMSFWANVFLGKCLSGQMSFWANVFWANVVWANVVSPYILALVGHASYVNFDHVDPTHVSYVKFDIFLKTPHDKHV
jgi:hypothetical protein